jgi:hypothetical protein
MNIISRFFNNEQRTVWAFFLGASFLLALGFFLQVQSDEKTAADSSDHAIGSDQPKSGGSIELTRLNESSADLLLAEEATLFDPTPMFLPTQWNSGQNALPDNLIRVPGRSFQDYPPKLIYREASLALSLPSGRGLPDRAVEVLAKLDLESPLMALGKEDASLAKLEGRMAQIEVTSAKTGQRVLVTAVQSAAVPGEEWQPLEFLVAIDPAGVVGAPVITERSGSEPVDRFFRDYLAKTMRVGERLAPGAYRVLVGP